MPLVDDPADPSVVNVCIINISLRINFYKEKYLVREFVGIVDSLDSLLGEPCKMPFLFDRIELPLPGLPEILHINPGILKIPEACLNCFSASDLILGDALVVRIQHIQPAVYDLRVIDPVLVYLFLLGVSPHIRSLQELSAPAVVEDSL